MTGDPWAAYTDIVTASQLVEQAIHGAPVRPTLEAAADQIRHAHDYYATAGDTGLAAEAATVAGRLRALAHQDPPPAGPTLYEAVWGQPVRAGTLAHLWRRAAAVITPSPPWATWLGLGLGVVGLGATVVLAHAMERQPR